MPSINSGSKHSARTGSRFFYRLDRSVTERYLSAVLEHMTEGLILARPDGQIKAMNRAALQMHELDDAAAIEGPFSRLADFIELRDAYGRRIDLDRWPIARAVRGETFTGDEVEVVDRRTGRRWFANFGGTAIHSPEQGIHFALVTMRDVTSRRRNETELVRRARKLEQLNEELRRFASVVSHDLQAPMRLISSNLDLLAEDLGSSDSLPRCHLERAREAAIRMRAMIRGVL
ncbi:MAG: PAS domain S-box protein, partial [Planctomycetota bacterium]